MTWCASLTPPQPTLTQLECLAASKWLLVAALGCCRAKEHCWQHLQVSVNGCCNRLTALDLKQLMPPGCEMQGPWQQQQQHHRRRVAALHAYPCRLVAPPISCLHHQVEAAVVLLVVVAWAAATVSGEVQGQDEAAEAILRLAVVAVAVRGHQRQGLALTAAALGARHTQLQQQHQVHQGVVELHLTASS